MANRWRDDDYNRWSEEEARRSADIQGRYDQPRQFSQDFSSGRQFESGYGSDYRAERNWRQRERLRRSAPDIYPQHPQYQQENYAQPGTFYYGGDPQRRFGLGPTEPPFEGEPTPDEYGVQRTPMSYGGYGYTTTVTNPRDVDEVYRRVGRFERDFMHDDTPDRFHPDKNRNRESAYAPEQEHRRGFMERARGWIGHRGKGPKGYTRSDDRIREDISDHLTQDDLVDASNIEVAVMACECTLNGTVPTREEKRRAEDIAESIMGVKHVQNNLRVAPTSTSALSSQDRTGTMSTTIGSNPVLSASRNTGSSV